MAGQDHEARAQIDESARAVDRLASAARVLLRASATEEAVATVATAAHLAWHRHPGAFRQPALEAVLRRAARRTDVPVHDTAPPREVRRVLHVMSLAAAVGGHSALVRRWTERDAGREHRLHVTCQREEELPGWTGRLQHVTATSRGAALSERLRHLRERADDVDLVALHVHPFEVLPTLALGTKRTRIVYVNHADHVSWLPAPGHVVHLRASGARLAEARRGLPGAQLPIPLVGLTRGMSRVQARRLLGLPDGAVVALSIGSAYKYQGGRQFLSLVLPLLEQHQDLVVMVVGPSPEGMWGAGHPRLRVLGVRDDLPALHAASDLYLEGLPFASLTALLEAAAAGLPCVSRIDAREAGSVFASDSPGLDREHLVATSDEAWRSTVSGLVDDEVGRRARGARIARDVREAHLDGWSTHLESLYEQVLTTVPERTPPPARTTPDDLDLRLALLHRDDPAFPGLHGIVQQQRPWWSPRTRRLLKRLPRLAPWT